MHLYQDPPPPFVKDVIMVPPIILVVDLEENGVIPVLDKVVEVIEVKEDDFEEDNGLELHDLARPEVFPVVLRVVPPKPIVEIADLEDAPPPVFDDDGGYDTEPQHIRRFKL